MPTSTLDKVVFTVFCKNPKDIQPQWDGRSQRAALCNASASVLQRKASRTEDSSEQFSLHMLWDLAHRPAWVFRILTMLTGFLLHAVSISVAPISLVQPLLIAELPSTLVLASLTFHSPIDRRDWLAIGMASLGLAVFVVSLAAHGGSANQVSVGTWVIAITATVLVRVRPGWDATRLPAARAFCNKKKDASLGLEYLARGVGSRVRRRGSARRQRLGGSGRGPARRHPG